MILSLLPIYLTLVQLYSHLYTCIDRILKLFPSLGKELCISDSCKVSKFHLAAMTSIAVHFNG